MLLVNRHELMRLPPGTIYQEYDPAILGPLMIKGDTISDATGLNIDWFESHVTADVDMHGKRFALSCIEGREANYSDELRYLVYEGMDIGHMISRLRGCTGLDDRTLPLPD